MIPNELFLGVFDSKYQKELADSNKQQESESDTEDIGGLFKKVSKDQRKLKLDKDSMDLTESCLRFPWNTECKDWTDEEVSKIIDVTCFGKHKKECCLLQRSAIYVILLIIVHALKSLV